MQKQLLILALLFLGFFESGNSQTLKNHNLKGTWTSMNEQQVGVTLIISEDTMFVNYRGDYGCFERQLFKFTIERDTLIATELEYFNQSWSVGNVLEHYKNRQIVVKIPVCIFRNDCTTSIKTVKPEIYTGSSPALDFERRIGSVSRRPPYQKMSDDYLFF